MRLSISNLSLLFTTAICILGQSDFASSKNLQGLPEDSAGWTILRPSNDSRMIYVSASGSDSNDGLSSQSPKLSVVAGYELLRHGHPDWLLLKSGETFPATSLCINWKKSGRSPMEPMVMASFGSGARPMIRGFGGGVCRSPGGGAPDSVENLAFMGIHFFADQWNGQAHADQYIPQGFMWLGGGRNILIEDSRFEHFVHGISIDNLSHTLENISIRRNIVIDNFGGLDGSGGNIHSQGILAGGITGLLIQENVIDRNGWLTDSQGHFISTPPDVFKHNIYLSDGNSKVEILGNISSRASSHGMTLNTGGTVQNNLFVRDPIGAYIAHGEGIISQVRGNVVTAGVDINLGDGTSAPRGWGIDINTFDAEVDSNLITATNVNHFYGLGFGMGGKGADSYKHSAKLTNNVVNNWKGVGLNVWGSGLDASSTSGFKRVIFQNNRIRQSQGGYLIGYPLVDFAPDIFQFGLNTYYSNNPVTRWFNYGMSGLEISLGGWVQLSLDSGSVAEEPRFSDPNRTIESYAASIGIPATFEAFIAAARNQSKSTRWDPALSALAVNDYFRAGFDMKFDDIEYSTASSGGSGDLSATTYNGEGPTGCTLQSSTEKMHTKTLNFWIIISIGIIFRLRRHHTSRPV